MSQNLVPAGLRSYSAPLASWPEYRQPTRDPELGPMRRQVMAIISSILDDVSPEAADVRSRLRLLLTRHPGCPEKALLEHLRSMHSDFLNGFEDLSAASLPEASLVYPASLACRTTSPQDCTARSVIAANISAGGLERSSGNSTMSISVLRILLSFISPAPA